MEYIVNVENDAQKELFYPFSYGAVRDLYLIEPLYDNLKQGQKVKFKFKSDYFNTITIIDQEWNYLKKNNEGFFEKEIIIQSQSGETISVCGNNNSSYTTLIQYKVV